MLSWFLRSRRTCLAVLNTAVKSWYYKIFSKFWWTCWVKLLCVFRINEDPKWHKPIELDLIFGYGQFWLQPLSLEGMPPPLLSVQLSLTGDQRDWRWGWEWGQRGFFEAQVLKSSLSPSPNPYLQSLAPRPLFPPQAHAFEISLPLYRAGLDHLLNLRRQGPSGNTSFFSLPSPEPHMSGSRLCSPLQEWLKIWFGLELRVSFSREGKRNHVTDHGSLWVYPAAWLPLFPLDSTLTGECPGLFVDQRGSHLLPVATECLECGWPTLAYVL